MKVEVSGDDIYRGKRGDSHNCAIALAMQRLGFSGVEVQFDQVTYVAPQCYEVIRSTLPREVEDFVAAFDSGKEVTPLSFELDAVSA